MLNRDTPFNMGVASNLAILLIGKERVRLDTELHSICEENMLTVGGTIFGFIWQGNVYPPNTKGRPEGLGLHLSERMFKYSMDAQRLANDKAYFTQGLYIATQTKIHSAQDLFDMLPDHMNYVLPAGLVRTRPPFWNMDDTPANQRLIKGLTDKGHFYYALQLVG